MADTTVVDAPPPPPPSSSNDFNGLQVPPLDPNFLNQDLQFADGDAFNFNSLDQNDVLLEDLDFDLDFSFDDLLPDSLEQPLPDPALFESNCFVLPGSDPNLIQFVPDRSLKDVAKAIKSTSPEFLHASCEHFCGDCAISNSSSSPVPEVCEVSGDQVSGGQSLERNQISGDRGQDVSGYLNIPSPESNGFKGSNDSRLLNCPSPESQGSGNCGSDISEDSNKSVSSSPNFENISVRNVQKVKLELLNNGSKSQALLKRKKESEDSNISDSRTNKSRKSTINLTEKADSRNNNVVLSEEEEKRRARLMRNRESAQLSRQRKKHYVDELEDKVKNMASTIQELNAQITYISHENARLRQQVGGGMVPAAPMAAPPPPPGMYPQMMYPWMPCGVRPYLVKPQGSQVPLVPIPRLKPQQPVPAPKASKKGESKKSEKSEGKTKKVASVSFLGLMFFMLLFGGLVPMVNVRYGGVREAFNGGLGYAENQFYEKHRGRVLAVDGNVSGNDHGDKYSNVRDFVKTKHRGQGLGGRRETTKEHEMDEFAHVENGSVPLAASLYVPRNDKLVKIEGNLIIHSFLASERAMASQDDPAKKAGSETQLAVHGDFGPGLPISGGSPPHLHRNPSERQRALGSAYLKSSAADGRLQEWFREGLEGPMLSSGMCTEVFQFDVSSAIVPATPTRNVSMEPQQNSTPLKKGKNRRILRGHPVTLPGSPHNISDDHEGSNSKKEEFKGNNSLSSSMVVSVLVDPREVGDVDGSGVIGPKSLSRIFVVVLIDSVKYVTYSCMLPFKGAGPHLVTT